MNLTSLFKVFINKLICHVSHLAQPGQFSVPGLSQNKSIWRWHLIFNLYIFSFLLEFVVRCYHWSTSTSKHVLTNINNEHWGADRKKNLLVRTSSLSMKKGEETGKGKTTPKGELNSLKLCQVCSLAGCKVNPGTLLCLQQVRLGQGYSRSFSLSLRGFAAA